MTRSAKTLVFLDALAIFLFCAGGIFFHDVPGSLLFHVLRIAGPFVVGYFPLAYLVGAYQVEGGMAAYLGRSAQGWFGGISAGIILRGLLQGAVPLPSFVGFTLGFTGVCIMLFRTCAWPWVRPQDYPPGEEMS